MLAASVVAAAAVSLASCGAGRTAAVRNLPEAAAATPSPASLTTAAPLAAGPPLAPGSGGAAGSGATGTDSAAGGVVATGVGGNTGTSSALAGNRRRVAVGGGTDSGAAGSGAAGSGAAGSGAAGSGAAGGGGAGSATGSGGVGSAAGSGAPGSVGGSSTAAIAPASDDVVTCRTADLRVAFDVQPRSGTQPVDRVRALVVITDLSGPDCTLQGFALVGIAERRGWKALGARPVDQPGPPVAVAVEGGGSAFAGMEWTGAAGCPVVSAFRLGLAGQQTPMPVGLVVPGGSVGPLVVCADGAELGPWTATSEGTVAFPDSVGAGT